jgi:membrane protease YdiL (CAAX protease family)
LPLRLGPDPAETSKSALILLEGFGKVSGQTKQFLNFILRLHCVFAFRISLSIISVLFRLSRNYHFVCPETTLKLPSRNYPKLPKADAWAFVVLTYIVSWTLWILAIKLRLREEWLNLGTAGPALVAIFLSHRRQPNSPSSHLKKWAWCAGLLLPFWFVLLFHYQSGRAHVPNIQRNLALIVACVFPVWIVCGILSPDVGVHSLLRRLVHLPNRWSVYAFISFPAFLLIPAGIAHLCGQTLYWPPQSVTTLVMLGHAALFFGYNLIFVAVQEEPGWRGFLLDRLQCRCSPLLATLLVWLPWSLWHGPLDYFRPVRFSLVVWILLRIVFMIPLTIILTWFYNHSGRSILTTAIFHAGMNTFPLVLPYFRPAYTLVFIWALYAVVADRMWRLRAPTSVKAIT